LDFEYLNYLGEGHNKDQILQDLMTAYGQDVWNFAFSLTRHRDAADDIAQECFLKAYRNLESFRGKSSVKTWLLTITKNAVRDYRRSAFIRKVTLMDKLPRGEAGGSLSAEQEALDQIVADAVWRKVLALPAKYRAVLVLYAHHQLSMEEISQLLSISVGTVKSRLFRARQRVTAMIEEDM
jgi:RNA polymerase sigma-70 factor (ECF subfamily)